MYDLTVIIPTFKEESNIGTIIKAVDAVFLQNRINGEILIVDDNSPDRTIELVREMQKTLPYLSLAVRIEDPGLSQSVVEGFRRAQSDIFLVIDADLSHPPEHIPLMLAEIRAGNDIVIGSRYMEGGGIKKWPLKRRIISLGATFLGRLLFPEIHDPVSGFFAVKRGVVDHAPLRPRGYKILLEVLGKGTWHTVKEIPFEFVDRAIGSSKLGWRTIIEYAAQVLDNARFSWNHHGSVVWQEWVKLFRFGIVGLTGIIVNEGLLIYLRSYAQFALPVASIISIELSILSNFILNDSWTFKTGQHALPHWWQRLLSFQVVSLGGAAINFVILNALALYVGVDYRVANILGIVVAFAWNFLVNRRVTWKKSGQVVPSQEK
ncbi:Dolichyl-phosphate beta-D-mannosyltransferase [Methanoregula boonei 6A8]|jgi:dolichol-phosphate mannosyltransferase|uniref:Dolichyl-phosphate beta-D-mannosyltransferase n=1 Tax=Methanoregula boonei (strain DSM 21154 / JCM 14090 / 6A8) TaxID=456442 RepID=A7IB53_METB6|nr:glycosyltransferase family 2 protein [Methanoregula boonei]ABS56964.1 Dolichyl-phosphate beta-D-mannosyltransferase [Methanoregula boonei 6A8]